MLEAGQPLVMLVPLTDKEVIVKKHLIGKDEMIRKYVRVTTFHNHYVKEKKIQQQKEKKCPFHFGS